MVVVLVVVVVCVCVCDQVLIFNNKSFSPLISQLGYNDNKSGNGNFHQPEEILSVIDFANYKTTFHSNFQNQ